MAKWISGLSLLLWSIAALASGTISGVVTAQDTSIPLPGVTVRLDEECSGGGCLGLELLTTDSNGRYSTSKVQNGLTYVSAYYLPDQANYAPAEGGFQNVDDGAPLTVNFVLVPGATVEGVVRAKASGAPLPNIRLYLEAHEPGGGADLYYNSGDVLSDSQGRYTFRQLPASSYEIIVITDGATPYRNQYYSGHDFTAPSQGKQAIDIFTLIAGQKMTADFALNVGGKIEGVLTDRYDGTPIANAQGIDLNLYDVTPAHYCCVSPFDYRKVTTDAFGHFVLQGLTDGPFYLSASSWTPWYSISYIGCPDRCPEVDEGTEFQIAGGATQILNIALFPGAVVTGTVTRHSDGEPISGVTVSGVGVGQNFIDVYATGTTDALGRYSLRGQIYNTAFGVFGAQSGGTSFVDQLFDHHDCPYGNCFQLGDNPQAPEYQVTPNIDFSLDTGASISGRVLTNDTQSGIHAYVFLYAPDRSFSAQIETSDDGQFRTSALQPGAYYLAAQPFDLVPYSCTFYGDALCDSDFFYSAVSGAQSIPLDTSDLGGIVIELKKIDAVFQDGFEQL